MNNWCRSPLTLDEARVILGEAHVILGEAHVILGDLSVILSEAKDLEATIDLRWHWFLAQRCYSQLN